MTLEPAVTEVPSDIVVGKQIWFADSTCAPMFSMASRAWAVPVERFTAPVVELDTADRIGGMSASTTRVTVSVTSISTRVNPASSRDRPSRAIAPFRRPSRWRPIECRNVMGH